VATFLVERYWPGVTAAAAQAVTAKLGRDGNATVASAEATESSGPSGDRIVVVETIVAAADEVCFWYVEAASENEITGAFKSVGVPIDRISPATALPDASEAR
jgi:pectate lyase